MVCSSAHVLASALVLAGLPPAAAYKCLFMGHSFFAPVARKMPNLATVAGVSHSQDIVASGGSTGAPMALWNDPVDSRAVKAHLDTGDVELFGMTLEPTHPTLEGYQLWFDYALARNAETKFMIGLPWLDYPTDYDTSNYTSTYRTAVRTAWPMLLYELQTLYPNATIIDVPYGLGVIELRLLFEAGSLAADVSAMTGDAASALYVDRKGHGGDIVIDASSLIWLNRIYNLDLNTLKAQLREFGDHSTDLTAVAMSVLDAYDAGSLCGSDACSTVTGPQRSDNGHKRALRGSSSALHAPPRLALLLVLAAIASSSPALVGMRRSSALVL